MSTQVQSLHLMLDFNYCAMQAGRIVRSILSSKPVGLCWCSYYWNFSQFFLKFIINYFNVYYKISTPVVFCPGGLLSGVGIFSGLLSCGLLSGGLLSVHPSAQLATRSAVLAMINPSVYPSGWNLAWLSLKYTHRLTESEFRCDNTLSGWRQWRHFTWLLLY